MVEKTQAVTPFNEDGSSDTNEFKEYKYSLKDYKFSVKSLQRFKLK